MAELPFWQTTPEITSYAFEGVKIPVSNCVGAAVYLPRSEGTRVREVRVLFSGDRVLSFASFYENNETGNRRTEAWTYNGEGEPFLLSGFVSGPISLESLRRHTPAIFQKDTLPWNDLLNGNLLTSGQSQSLRRVLVDLGTVDKPVS